ncbi:MAG TPA: hypothetical protein VFW35_01585 [Sphingomicrobium sp.]|nr:hypothetical protein [Sphingomicrobium sp.]
MTFLRLLNIQGVAGLAVGLALALLLVIQKGETRHWKKESGHFEQLYGEEQTALAGTVADYRAAAAQAQASDKANAERVAAEQQSINERTSDDYEARLAAARSLAQRLRGQSAGAAADPRGGAGAPMPGLPAAAGGPLEAAGQDGFPQSDQLTATEQAIQLDELIKWVRAQAAVRPQAKQRPLNAKN